MISPRSTAKVFEKACPDIAKHEHFRVALIISRRRGFTQSSPPLAPITQAERDASAVRDGLAGLPRHVRSKPVVKCIAVIKRCQKCFSDHPLGSHYRLSVDEPCVQKSLPPGRQEHQDRSRAGSTNHPRLTPRCSLSLGERLGNRDAAMGSLSGDRGIRCRSRLTQDDVHKLTSSKVLWPLFLMLMNHAPDIARRLPDNGKILTILTSSTDRTVLGQFLRTQNMPTPNHSYTGATGSVQQTEHLQLY